MIPHVSHVTSARRLVALALLLALAGTLPGCGVRLMTRHAATGVPAPRAAAAPLEDPRDPYWTYHHAEKLVGADSLVAAEHELRASLALDSTYAPALALLSRLWYADGRHREAVALLEPVRRHPDAWPAEARAGLLAGLALHEAALGEPQLAREAMAPALHANERAAGSAGVYLALSGDAPDSAADASREMARRDGHSAVNQNNVGITRLRAGDPDGAKKAFEAAIERDPALPGPYYNLAILEKYWRFDDEAATRAFRAYWQRSHDDPDGLFAVFAAHVAANPDTNGARP